MRNFLLACVVFLICGVTTSYAAERTAIIFPDVREPYRTIFRDIVTGVKNSSAVTPLIYSFDENWRAEELRAWVSTNQITNLVVLGNQALNLAHAGNLTDVRITAGAITNWPNHVAVNGVAYLPAPSALFKELTRYANTVRRVHVIYESSVNAWQVEIAQREIERLGFSLQVYKVASLQEAAKTYSNLLSGINPKTDAIWLPLDDQSLDSRVILPMILKESWNRAIVVFSSNPAHVSRGVLFSLYPDSRYLGQQLVPLSQATTASVLPADKLKKAFNIRTAEHLNINITDAELKKIDILFPAR
ncbi:MAG: hypothetical protein H0W44_06235 [Gammaproteobacteria bacterium]|nr:hypothetical protein [Gammaproteobacteria bacterium]